MTTLYHLKMTTEIRSQIQLKHGVDGPKFELNVFSGVRRYLWLHLEVSRLQFDRIDKM